MENSKNQMNFSIWFWFNDNGLLYLAMKNIYPALIIGIALRFTTMPNRKLYTAESDKVFCLVLTFLLPLSNNFQLSLPNLYGPVANPREAIAVFQLISKSLIVSRAFYLLYPILAEIVITNKTITITMSEFITKQHTMRTNIYNVIPYI